MKPPSDSIGVRMRVQSPMTDVTMATQNARAYGGTAAYCESDNET